jgi:D-2-hydroxyacid dehydrogenase (NADP+)
MKLLLSDFALRTWGSRITAADAGLSLVTAEEALAADGPSAIDIAFMTREVTGRSSKDNQTPELRGFEAVLRKSPRLRWLQIHPAGAERPIYRELRDRGVKVTTASGATAVTVSHSVLGAVIAVNRRFPLLADAQRRHAWEPRLGERSPRDLKGQCAVIVGMGPIGRNIAALLKMLGMSVVGVRRTAEPVAPCDQTIAYGQLLDVLPKADWLILCCPASAVTRGIANAAAFAAMPMGSHFVNVSRGEIAVEGRHRSVAERPAGGRLSRRVRARAARCRLAAVGHAQRAGLAAHGQPFARPERGDLRYLPRQPRAFPRRARFAQRRRQSFLTA